MNATVAQINAITNGNCTASVILPPIKPLLIRPVSRM